MLWIRYTVFVLLLIFLTTSIASNVLPIYRYTSSDATGAMDPTANVYVHTSSFYLWYQEVLLAADATTGAVEFPQSGSYVVLPAKTKLVLRVVTGNMQDFTHAGDDGFSHVYATCGSLSRELQAASALSVLGSVFGGCALGVVMWGRGATGGCVVPGWVAFSLTFLAALFSALALALTAHTRSTAMCYHYAFSQQSYSFGSGCILMCVTFAGYVITGMLQALCPMLCCCCSCCDGAGYGDGYQEESKCSSDRSSVEGLSTTPPVSVGAAEEQPASSGNVHTDVH